jgi:UDP-N-acetylglucosamine 2-epimerase (non-hydrolysing)
LRKNTERPVTISHGTNILCNSDEKKIMSEALKIMNGRSKKTRTPEYWDGKTAKRIAEILITEVGKVGRVKE